MPRSQLQSVLNRAQSLTDYVNALSEDERNFILDLLPEQEEKPKKTRKKRQPKAEKIGLPRSSDSVRCAVEGCGEIPGHPNHDSTYLSSHPFVPAAQSARKRSSVKDKASPETTKEPDLSSGVAA
jgi:hypothetical protein